MSNDKRRFVTQLPEVFQTETLKKFFGSTVDHLFQPGRAETISGYIGQKPIYYDPNKDFYVQEPTAARQAYQLEPALVTKDGNDFSRVFFYDDLINYVRASNGIIADHNRLFADHLYSWAPPVDLDKLQNFQQYYWFGDKPGDLPSLKLTAEYTETIADGETAQFPLPERHASIDPDLESIVVFVDGIEAEAESDGSDVLLVTVPPKDAVVTAYRYGDLRRVIEGHTHFDPSPFNAQGVSAVTSNMRITLVDAASRFIGYDRQPWDSILLKNDKGRWDVPAYDTLTWDEGVHDLEWDKATHQYSYWVEGVGTSIRLIEFNDRFEQIGRNPNHVVIDRRSKDGNPWSRGNFWVHGDSFAWSGEKFPARRATRPIIEFVANLELHNYGSRRLPDINAITTAPLYSGVPLDDSLEPSTLSDWDIVAYDTKPNDGRALVEIPLEDANGKLPNTIFVDGWHKLRIGDRVLVRYSNNPQLKNRILTVRPGRDAFVDETVVSDYGHDPYDTRPLDSKVTLEHHYSTGVMVLEVGPAPRKGDIVRKKIRGHVTFDSRSGYDQEPWDYSADPVEYYFDGTQWKEAQGLSHQDADPRFALYDADKTPLERLPNSTFDGSRIFGFAKGSGSIDKVLQRAVKHDNYGQIVFENDLETRRTSDGGEAAPGYHFYKVIDDNGTPTFHNGWFATGETSKQDAVNGVYPVPLSLRANPDNEEVTFISRNQWFEHFTAIIARQEGMSGSSVASNNWRDTARDLGLGKKVIQHRSPLLKTMLLASDKRFDYPDAVRYVEQEYTRFRNKFVQQIMEVLRTGQRVVEDSPDVWVDTILQNLRVAKTNDFPFALSNVAGGQYFIPPTAAALGLIRAVEPGFEVDDTYSPAVTFLRGHDGSRTPAFGDLRDMILLAFERRIYENLPARFTSESKPEFDFYDFTEGRNRRAEIGSLRYSRDDLTRLFTPMMMRWAQLNGFDYRKNQGYAINDPFTWNYRGIIDRGGDPLPGNWRAIYRWYFDTDRPHLAPWEMLGFRSMPSWWESEYGPAPYTRGNEKLWEDLRDGRIAAGPRQGIDARFARPDLLEVLPVNDDGVLLDPVAARIVINPPTFQQANRSWMIGDHGPVENLWMNSVSYGYALSQVGFLMRPAQWVEMGWDTGNFAKLIDGQWYNKVSQNRPRAFQIRVHGEADDSANRISISGIQQWIVDHMVSRAQDPAILGDAIRSMGVNLAHKMAGYTQRTNLRVFADNFGLIPEEDVHVLKHASPPIREASYSGLIIEWTGEGWRIIGYDNIKEEFITIPGERTGPQTVISLGDDENLFVYEWRPNVHYQKDRLVDYKGSTYKAVQAHTSSQKFEDEFWSAQPGLGGPRNPRVTIPTTGSTEPPVKIPYNTTYTTYQEVAEFISDYSRWLESEGWVFDGVDPDTGETQDWNLAIREFLKWAQMDWQPGNFISLSPGASTLKFVTEHGYVYNIEETTNGVYGLIDRTGKPIPRRSTFISRLDEETKIVTVTDNLFGARLRVGEAEHVVVFSNLTIFGDTIYSPLFDLRQPRLRMIGLRTKPWNGRHDAPGFMLEGDNLLPNFEKATDNIRDMFEIERSDDRVLRDHTRHVIGYQGRNYLDNLLLSETQQFEFYQGMIQQKGAPGVFNKLGRSRFIEQDRDLRFLEEWAFRVGRYGAVDNRQIVSFRLDRTDIRANPQFIRFGQDNPHDAIVGITNDSARWIERPKDINAMFPARKDGPDFDTERGYDEYAYDIRGWDPHPVAGGPQLRVRGKFLPTSGYARVDEIDYAVFRQDLYDTLYNNLKDEGKTLDVGDRIWVYSRDDGDWDVMVAEPIGEANNFIWYIETSTEDGVLFDTIRVVFSTPHGLTEADENRWVAFTSNTLTDPNLEGFHRIAKVESETSFILDVPGFAGINFSENGGDETPSVVILRSARFETMEKLNERFDAFGAVDGEIAYVDDAGDKTWVVLKWDEAEWEWVTYREQPQKIDSERLTSTLIYNLTTKTTGTSLMAEPLVLNGITVIDPVAGLIPGMAERELHYKLEYDPAGYNRTYSDFWGIREVGRLWWDLSTVRFLEVETDTLDSDDNARQQKEIDYRVTNWGRIAPGSSVDVYEWTRSLVHPTEFNGVIRNQDNPAWVESEEFDAKTGKIVTAYYFWVRNPVGVPSQSNRKISAAQVAQLIENPKSNDLPWIAPIMANGLLVGGMEQYLNDGSSVLQFELTDDAYEGAVHSEWQLVRSQDDRTLPPANLWTAMRNSLVGLNDQNQQVPDPSLPERSRVGFSIRPRQTLFADGRDGMLAARRSFVEMINAMLARTNFLAENPHVISLLTAESPTYDYLIRAQRDGESQIDNPPANSYTMVVDSMEERNELLETDEFLRLRGFLPFDQKPYDTAGWDQDAYEGSLFGTPRILVRNIDSSTPSWSVWEANPDAPAFATPDEFLRLSRNYHREVATRAERDALIEREGLQIGERVLVRRDENADNFWTVWVYEPTNGAADDLGFVFQNGQTYRTRDFWNVVDWYAQGYSQTNAPVVQYDTVEDRNLAEMPNPLNTFVKVKNDGTGSWVWTVYENGNWTVVARQNGTIRLSKKFYDSSRNVYSGAAATPSQIANRDGSWELRVVIDILRDAILTNAQVNELFFSMLHFMHTQQDQVEWAFKTSFLSVVGFNERLTQTPVKTFDNTENLLSYLDEVKPYRVKTRDFSRMLTPDIDQANAYATDFDKPLYWDEAQGKYRRLDPANPNDALILTTEQPWKDWYESFANGSIDPASENFNPVRRMEMKMRFDRIDPLGDAPLESGFGWDYLGFDQFGYDTVHDETLSGGSALARMLAFYKPTEGMREKNQEALFNMGFKGVQIEGGDFYVPAHPNASDWDVRGFDTIASETPLVTELDAFIDGADEGEIAYNADGAHYALVDPYHAANRPEELMVAKAIDGLAMTVRSGWTIGAPNQYTTHVNTARMRRSVLTVSYENVAQSAQGILVYRDGIRAVEGIDYTIDHFARTVAVNLVTEKPRTRNVLVHVFGPAGLTRIVEQKFYNGDGTKVRFALDKAPEGLVEVTVNGAFAQVARIDGKDVILAEAPGSDADVMIIVRARASDYDVVPWEPAYDTGTSILSTATRVQSDVLAYNADQTWSLAKRTMISGPEHIGTIVEVNGKRLTPPFTRYGRFDQQDREMRIRKVYDRSNLRVWIDGNPYAEIIPVLDTPDFTEHDLIVVGDRLMAAPGYMAREVLCCVYEDHEYDVYSKSDYDSLDRVPMVGWDRSGFDLAGFDTTPEDTSVPNDGWDTFAWDQAYEGILTITKPLGVSDYDTMGWDASEYDTNYSVDPDVRIETTTFENAILMGIKTHVFDGSADGRYVINNDVPSTDYLMVTVGGKRIASGIDFTSTRSILGYDQTASDAEPWDNLRVQTAITIPGGQNKGDKVVIMAFTGDPARMPGTWGALSARAGMSMMGDPVLGGDWENSPFDTNPTGTLVARTAVSSLGERPLYRMNGTWEVFEWSDASAGRLDNDLTEDADEISITMNPFGVVGDFLPESLFADPDIDRGIPGVIWINGERVEYFEMEREAGRVVLRNLRRGTRGTPIGVEQRAVRFLPGDGVTTVYRLLDTSKTGIDLAHIEDNGKAIPLAEGTHYSLQQDGEAIIVTLVAPVPVNQTLRIGQTGETMHPAGAIVRHASPDQAGVDSPFRIKDEVPLEADDPMVAKFGWDAEGHDETAYDVLG